MEETRHWKGRQRSEGSGKVWQGMGGVGRGQGWSGRIWPGTVRLGENKEKSGRGWKGLKESRRVWKGLEGYGRGFGLLQRIKKRLAGNGRVWSVVEGLEVDGLG